MKKSNLKKGFKKILQSQNAITLIALVITIVILLILAGITLNLALDDDGIIKKAIDVSKKYKESEENELDELADFENNLNSILTGNTSIEDEIINYNDYVGAYVTNYIPDSKTNDDPCIIETTTSGYTKEQKFTTEQMEWQIWDYDEQTQIIRLISSKPTTDTLYISDAPGYNNGVYAINEICRKCYGQYDESGEMKTGISVSNLKRSDIQKVTTYDYTKYSHNSGNSIDENGKGKYKYGSTTTCSTATITYPIMWEKDSKWAYENKNGIITNENEKEGLIWELENGYTNETGTKSGTASTQFKESSWQHDYDSKSVNKNDWINPKYYDLLFGSINNHFNKNYWLACRSVILLWDNSAYFSVQYICSQDASCLIGSHWTFRTSRWTG